MSKSLSKQAYESIKRDIITCVFEPGSQIAQPMLAERYEIGMTPIREALKQLTQEGLVQSIPRYGYIVSPITFSSIAEIYEVRSILESAAARLAAKRATDIQLETLVNLQNFKIIPNNRENYLLFITRNEQLHLKIAEASGNKKLFAMIKDLHEKTVRFFHFGRRSEESSETMRQEHLKIAEAISSRDEDQAEKLMKEHIRKAQARAVKGLSRKQGFEISTFDQTLTLHPQVSE